MKKTTYLIEPCEDGQLPKAEDSAAILESDPVNVLEKTTWDEWFDEEKVSSDFMLLREQS